MNHVAGRVADFAVCLQFVMEVGGDMTESAPHYPNDNSGWKSKSFAPQDDQ